MYTCSFCAYMITVYVHTYAISWKNSEGDWTGNVSDIAVAKSTCRISQQQECFGTSRAVSRSSGSCQQIKQKDEKVEKEKTTKPLQLVTS